MRNARARLSKKCLNLIIRKRILIYVSTIERHIEISRNNHPLITGMRAVIVVLPRWISLRSLPLQVPLNSAAGYWTISINSKKNPLAHTFNVSRNQVMLLILGQQFFHIALNPFSGWWHVLIEKWNERERRKNVTCNIH